MRDKQEVEIVDFLIQFKDCLVSPCTSPGYWFPGKDRVTQVDVNPSESWYFLLQMVVG